jgi:hypothetical protein
LDDLIGEIPEPVLSVKEKAVAKVLEEDPQFREMPNFQLDMQQRNLLIE